MKKQELKGYMVINKYSKNYLEDSYFLMEKEDAVNLANKLNTYILIINNYTKKDSTNKCGARLNERWIVKVMDF